MSGSLKSQMRSVYGRAHTYLGALHTMPEEILAEFLLELANVFLLATRPSNATRARRGRSARRERSRRRSKARKEKRRKIKI